MPSLVIRRPGLLRRLVLLLNRRLYRAIRFLLRVRGLRLRFRAHRGPAPGLALRGASRPEFCGAQEAILVGVEAVKRLPATPELVRAHLAVFIPVHPLELPPADR